MQEVEGSQSFIFAKPPFEIKGGGEGKGRGRKKKKLHFW